MDNLRLEALASACDIDMVQTVAPGGVCTEQCIHCGAFDEFKGAAASKPLTRDQLRENLTQELPSLQEDVKGQVVANYLAPFLTTDVNVEPTHNDAFIDAAELVHELTEGRSRMLFISHGVRKYVRTPRETGDKNMGKHIIRQITSVFDTKRGENLGEPEAGYPDEKWDEVFEILRSRGIEEDVIAKIEKARRGKYQFNEQLIEGLNVVEDLLEKGVAEAYCFGKDDQSAERLSKVAQMVHDGIVPGAIITLDFARAQGRINFASNAASYIKTLQLLKPAMAESSQGFVTVSVQGLQNVDVDHPYGAHRALIFFQEILSRAGLTDREKSMLRGTADLGREIVGVGRGKNQDVIAQYLHGDEACEIVPDQAFVDKVIKKDRKLLRARLLAAGGIEWQQVKDGATYNTTVKGPWRRFVDAQDLREFDGKNGPDERKLSSEIGGGPVSRLTRSELSKKAKLLDVDPSWDHFLDTEDDIFLMKPFSRVKKPHRKAVLNYLQSVFGVDDLVKIPVLDKKGIRGVKYRDVKLSCLMSIYPGEDVGVLIHDASPYKEFVDDPEFMGEMSATGEAEAGVALGRTSYLAGEIFALTRALMEKIPVLEYLEADLALQLKAPNGDSEDDNNGSGGGPSSSGGGVE
ncbi:hypothetical protein HN709_00145 [Candidatus Peregrinibacteria bacterium]|jgi:hypothetical protein|nr:hypothetical protein [Candidatus Peregrinibacteria bacterium]